MEKRVINKKESLSDQQLLAAIVNKDQSAFNELYNRYWRLFYSWTFSRVNHREMSQDITQIFWAGVWDKPEIIKTNGNGSAKSFLIHCLSYRILDYLKSTEAQLLGVEDKELEKISESSVYTHILEELELKELHETIDRILDNLPKVARKVYILRERENLSVQEIAEHLSISPKTVRNNLSQAFGVIRKELGNSAVLWLYVLYRLF